MSTKLILFLTLISITLSDIPIPKEVRSNLISKLFRYIHNRKPVFGMEGLMKFVSAFASASEYSCLANKESVEKLIKTKNLAPNIAKGIRASLYQTSPNVYEKIEHIESKIDSHHEIVGSTVKVGKYIYVIVVYGHALGEKIIQQRYETVERCKKVLFFTKECRKYVKASDRGFTPAELERIKDALAYAAGIYMEKKVLELQKNVK